MRVPGHITCTIYGAVIIGKLFLEFTDSEHRGVKWLPTFEPYDRLGPQVSLLAAVVHVNYRHFSRIIGYWHNDVVRLSIRCALWLSGLVKRAKSCTSVFLAGNFLFVPSETFDVVCIV